MDTKEYEEMRFGDKNKGESTELSEKIEMRIDRCKSGDNRTGIERREEV